MPIVLMMVTETFASGCVKLNTVTMIAPLMLRCAVVITLA
jgi:hypothetical protein